MSTDDQLHDEYAAAVAGATPRSVPAALTSPAADAQQLMAAYAAAVPADAPPVAPLDAGFGWPTTREAWIDVAERAAWNGVQAAAPLLLALFGIGGVAGVPWTAKAWLLVLTLFVSAALVSFAKNVIAWVAGVSPKGFRIDTAIGVATAFVGALAGYVVADPVFDVAHFDWLTAVRLSAGAAILSLTKMSVWPAVKQAIAKKNFDAAVAGPKPVKNGRHEAHEA